MVDAVTGVAKAIPVYQDIVQPAAQELGKAIQTVAKTVHIVLAPVSAFVWGYDQIKEFVSTKVAERLKNVPPENLVTPNQRGGASIGGSALHRARVIIAISMQTCSPLPWTRTLRKAHPAFVEIIKQLTPDEANLVALFVNDSPLPLINLRWEFKPNSEGKTGGKEVLVHYSHLGTIAGCEYPHMTPTYIDNLCRLGLAESSNILGVHNKGCVRCARKMTRM